MIEAGEYMIRSGILELVAGIALSRVEGACGIGMRAEHPEDMKKKKNLFKGIKAEVEEDRVELEIEVNMDYGKDFLEVGERIQKEVKGAVESMTGWNVEKVDVNVVGVNAV